MKIATLLRLNALSCIAFGVVFAAFPDAVSQFLGNPPSIVIMILGMVLSLHALHLFWASLRTPQKMEIQYFSLWDFLWVIGTAILLISKIWVTTAIGIASAIVVAAFVGALGALQLKSLTECKD